ncbi:hypothetical protein ACTFIV_007512 [Dictyostelium citrinum]
MGNFIYFLLCSIFFCYINCIELPTNEYNCFLTFLTKINIVSNFPKINSTYYNFCSNGIGCDSITGSIKDVTIINTFDNIGYNGQSILPSDLACLPNFNRIYFQNLNISKELLFYEFPQEINERTFYYESYPCSPIDQVLPKCFSFALSCKSISGSTIKISHIMKITNFLFEHSYVYFENDVLATQNISIVQFSATSLNYPDFSNFKSLFNFKMDFNENFVISSIQNYSTINSNSITFSHNLNMALPFYIPLNNQSKIISISAVFMKPDSMIDLSRYMYTRLSLSYVGQMFNFNGEIPIIPPPGCSFLINSGNFNVFPNFTYFTGDFFSTGSNFSMKLPSYSGKGQMITLASNNLFGEIDQSWCNTYLNIYGNNLTGTIPTCFTCYFSDPTMYGFFSGNNFNNYNQSIGCPEFAPRFELLDIGTMTFRVTGINIGYTPSYWILNSGQYPFKITPIRMGYEYNVSYSFAQLSNPKYFNILFTHPKPSMTLYFPIGAHLPNPTSIQITSNQLLIRGELFSSYMGYSNQSVEFEESLTNCIINDGTFFNITCEFDPSSISTLSYPTIIKIKNDNLIRRVIVNPQFGQINQLACPNNCDDISNSVCDLFRGICVNFLCENDCGIYGKCNNLTGVCNCDSNHQGPNCSISFKQCPTGLNSLICSGGLNFCNNQTGVCDCDSDHQGLACSLPFKQCPVGSDLICSGGDNNCNNQTGICNCDSNHQGPNCSISFKQCPTGLNSLICSGGLNFCNNQTGVCDCNSDHQGSTCSLPFKQCPVGSDSLICSGGDNNCNNQTGICSCNNKVTGDDCSKPNLYISSIIPSNTNGGEASFFGWFGDTHSNLSILIGIQKCHPITYNTSNEIKCIAPPGNGVYDITLKKDDIEYILRDSYRYDEIIKSCPNSCTNSNQGICNTSNGECKCINNYYSFDCSLKRNNDSSGNNGGNTSIDPSTGGTNITDNQVNFQIYFKNLFEIDFSGNIVNQYSLQSTWTFNKTKDSQSNNIYKLSQTIQQSCEIVASIEEISTSKQYSFAGSTFTLDAGSIKLTISISNYYYKSNLNTLQLQLISLADDNENQETDCNSKEVSTNEINTSSFKYIKISKDNRILQGRFINKVLSDGRPTYLSTDIKSEGNSIIATLNLPHFLNQSIIDPDFSVLLETDFKSECDTKNDRKWLIPVAVVVPIVGLCLIGALVYLIYIKKTVENPLKVKLKKLLKK